MLETELVQAKMDLAECKASNLVDFYSFLGNKVQGYEKPEKCRCAISIVYEVS